MLSLLYFQWAAVSFALSLFKALLIWLNGAVDRLLDNFEAGKRIPPSWGHKAIQQGLLVQVQEPTLVRFGRHVLHVQAILSAVAGYVPVLPLRFHVLSFLISIPSGRTRCTVGPVLVSLYAQLFLLLRR